MSRGPGRIMRRITEILAEQPTRGTGLSAGAVPLNYSQLASRVYDVDEPEQWQREAVGRAVRRLVALGQAQAWTDGAGAPYEIPSLAKTYVTPCSGEHDCAYHDEPKGTGEPPSFRDEQDRNWAAEFGWHEWTTVPTRNRRERYVRRPLTESEQQQFDEAIAASKKAMAPAIKRVLAAFDVGPTRRSS